MSLKATTFLLASVALGACTSRAVIGVADDSEATGGAKADGGAGGFAGTIAGAGASAGTGAAAGAGATSNVDVSDYDPLFPYPTTSYSEPYRGQFHFSTASGWMNDVDGLWFQDGVYHLAYQASPYQFQGGKNLHWAHATSTDLLHWAQQPLMLVPGVNVEGEAWSGSTVVDVNNTAGLQEGASPTVVAFYTSTQLGTSLSYSNDAGHSFLGYDANPVAIGDADYQTDRDPDVIWHAASNRWVCAFGQDGTTFYTSPDLKSWTRASSVAFGDIVPDFYELPLDGDAKNLRWVLQSAGGSYQVGEFDGQVFTPDATEARDMDVGPDFYASRSFFRQTLPDDRVVQLGWMRDGGNTTAPWRGSATFPVELRLKTFPSGIKLARTPIAELTQLYGARKHFGAQTLASGKNLLAGIRSKTFDLELVVATAKTTAKLLTFQIANKTFVYDFTKQLLLGAAFAPSDGTLKLRLLVDWGSLEVFANDGELSYTESVAFTPGDATLSVSADAELQLLSADFREVARTWPGRADADAEVLDDAAVAVTYDGSWNTVTDDATFFQDTCHFSSGEGAAFEATFTGTRVAWYGLRNTDLGKVDVLIDDVRVAEALDCYAPERVSAQLFRISGLSDSLHTIRVVARGDKNRASTGIALVHDYLVASSER